MPRYFKPALPRTNDNHPLWNRIIFAVCAGWDKARRDSGTNQVTPQDRAKGNYGTGINPIANSYTTYDAGWALQSDATSWFEWMPPPLGLFTVNAPFSCAFLGRPRTAGIIGGQNRRIFQKRLNGAATSSGFDMFFDKFVFLSWSFEWSNGAAEQTLRSTTVPSPERSDLVVGVLDPVGLTAQIWVNGILEAQAALALNPVDNALPIKICGGIGPAGDDGGDNICSMAAMWNRALTPRDIGQLWADPYILWRNPETVRYQAQQPVIAGVADNGCCCCC